MTDFITKHVAYSLYPRLHYSIQHRVAANQGRTNRLSPRQDNYNLPFLIDDNPQFETFVYLYALTNGRLWFPRRARYVGDRQSLTLVNHTDELDVHSFHLDSWVLMDTEYETCGRSVEAQYSTLSHSLLTRPYLFAFRDDYKRLCHLSETYR